MLQPRLWQHATRTNPEKGAEFAAQLANDESCPLVDVERVVDTFMSQNMIQPATSFLLDAQTGTRSSPQNESRPHTSQVADAILGNEMFTHYDHPDH